MTGVRAGSAMDATQRPVSRRMPDLERALGSIAATVAIHARTVLHTNDAILLGLTASTQNPAAALSPSLWDAQCGCREIRSPIGPGAAAPSWAALETAARRVLVELIRRWPANALPPALGLFTDGSGVAFSSDHPSPLAPGWLARHQAGSCPTTILHPFGPNAAWTLLMAPSTGGRPH